MSRIPSRDIPGLKRTIRRKAAWVAGLLCLLILFAACWVGSLWWSGRDTTAANLLQTDEGRNITEANFLKIRQGMTKHEVESIVGCPSGIYSTLPYRSTPAGPPKVTIVPASPRAWRTWVGDSVAIHLGFDAEDRVVAAECHPVYPPSRTVHLWDRTRKMLGF